MQFILQHWGYWVYNIIVYLYVSVLSLIIIVPTLLIILIIIVTFWLKILNKYQKMNPRTRPCVWKSQLYLTCMAANNPCQLKITFWRKFDSVALFVRLLTSSQKHIFTCHHFICEKKSNKKHKKSSILSQKCL